MMQQPPLGIRIRAKALRVAGNSRGGRQQRPGSGLRKTAWSSGMALLLSAISFVGAQAQSLTAQPGGQVAMPVGGTQPQAPSDTSPTSLGTASSGLPYGLSSLQGNGGARPLTFTPRLMLRETYTDNLNLAPANRAQGDFITEVVPGLGVRAEGRRIKGSLTYSLQGIAYAKHPGDDHVYNQVTGHGQAELLPRHLFLSVNSAYTQAVINSSAPSSTSNIFVSNNRTNAWISSVSPSYRQSLGSLGNARLSYTFNNIQYAQSSSVYGRLRNSHSNRYEFQLNSPRANDRWSWRTQAKDYHEWFSRGSQSIQRNAFGQLGYRLVGHLSVLARGGYERNVQKYATRSVFEGSYWAGGLRWRSFRNTYLLEYGHRFFGPTYTALWRHRAAYVTTELSYREKVQVVSQALLGQALEPNQVSTLPNVPYGSLTDYRMYVSKRFAGAISYSDPLLSVRLTGYDELRQYLYPSTSDRVLGAQLSAHWSLSARTTLSPSFSYEKGTIREGGPNYTELLPQLEMSYELRPHATLVLGYRYMHRIANGTSDNYAMNEMYAQLNAAF